MLSGTIADREEKANSNLVDLEIKVMEVTTNQTAIIETELKSISASLNDTTNDINETLTEKLEEKVENLSLKLINTQNTELLRVNDHINQKLNTLKGDKGDAGDKGDKGESGFLSGVSAWENGTIAKEGQAFSFKSGIWICSVKETALPPGNSDEYELVVDGINTIEVLDDNLIVTLSSDIQRDLGRVGLVHKGVYNSKHVYDKNDIVTIDKTSFVSLVDNNKNQPPSNTWKILSGRGAKGARGDKGDRGDVGFTPEDIIAVAKDIK